MKDIIIWLREIEHLAYEVYSEASSRFSHDSQFSTFLEQLAEEEAWHYHVMGSAAKYLEDAPGEEAAIVIDSETDKVTRQCFKDMKNGLESGAFSKDDFLEKVVEAEISEWNDIFLYVVNTLKRKTNEFTYPAARLQAHIKGIELYLRNVEEKLEMSRRINQVPPIWVEKILVVEDDEMVASLIKSLLNRAGVVELAENGKDALELIEKNYYKLIISDIDMPILDGLSMYEKAVQKYPTISSRILFITGNLSSDKIEYFEENNLQYLGKPMEIQRLREMSYRMVLSN